MTPYPYLRSTDLCRHFKRGGQVVKAVDGVTMSVERGEFVSLVGSSGSGKTTLLNLLAGLDSPSSGALEIEGKHVGSLTRNELARYRARNLSMIFQSFNLISHYTALQNVEMALCFTGTPPRERRRRAIATLEDLGLAERLHHRPADLSGGEQQRVAVARAVVKHPDILFADEPTGNLDLDNSNQIGSLLTALNKAGLTVIMVTHNLEMAEKLAQRTIRMRYGRIVEGASATERIS